VLAEDGRQAIERVARAVRPFDAVLMDVQMPVMDGLQAATVLAKSHPQLPVIGQTAHALKEEIDRCLAAGMVATVQKPLDLDLLTSTVLEHVRRSASQARAQPPRERAPLPMPPAAAVVDWTAFERRHASRPASVDRLRRLFVDRHSDFPAQLRASAAAEDFETIEHLAHDLKGAAGNVFAGGIESLASAALRNARRGDRSALDDALALALALEHVIDALRAGPTLPAHEGA
jgi:CheY-like chemotaxis protein